MPQCGARARARANQPIPQNQPAGAWHWRNGDGTFSSVCTKHLVQLDEVFPQDGEEDGLDGVGDDLDGQAAQHEARHAV